MMRPVYVRIDRPEGYEEVCGELVISDAQIRLPHEDVSEEISALESALASEQVRRTQAEDRLADVGRGCRCDGCAKSGQAECPRTGDGHALAAARAENERLRNLLADAMGALRLAEPIISDDCNDECESADDRAAGCVFDGPDPCSVGVALRAIRAVLAAEDAGPR
jgi:hypothetical protein